MAMHSSLSLSGVRHVGWLAMLTIALMTLVPASGAEPPRAQNGTYPANDPKVDAEVVRMGRLYGEVQWEVGKIIGIVDGDTADIKIGKRRIERLRLNEIDAPERGAPWSKRSTQLLSELIFGREVMIAITDWDRDDRAVVRTFVWSNNGKVLVDVSQEMIQQGAAWYFKRFGKDRVLLLAESGARKAGSGLWSLPDNQRVPPWEWRKMPKTVRDQHR